MKKEFLKVKTPAKLILSGEHAVVHGHPALSIAVNRYTEATARWSSPLHFSFNLASLDFQHCATLQALRKLKLKLKEKYNKHSLGHISIREVLQKPFELSLFTFINVLDKLKSKLPMGIDIVTDSNIPIGCGMGSSAASVVSIVYALTNFLEVNLPLDDYIKLGIESENLQHGHSSGLDVHTVYHGGCVYYQGGKFQARTLSNLPMTLVQTGRPQSTTGECVAHTASYFKNSTIGKDFSETTRGLDTALQQNNLQKVQEYIRYNHRLLNKINVVPDRVNDFIVDIEKLGAAGKICGAGSISGDQAGAVIVISEVDISAIAQQYGYQAMPIQADTRGTCVI